MNKFIDLHTHSTTSDGSMSPVELVRHAKVLGLTAIAITDHDTVSGVASAMEEGTKVGLEVIPGIEISVDFKPEMHILGYFLNNTYGNLNEVLEKLMENRVERNPKIIKKLNELGFDITMEEVEKEAKGSILGRPHIAKVLVKKGYMKTTEEVFDKLLASGRPAFFKKDKLSPQEGICEILKAGGIPVLAHPIYLGLNYGELDELLGSLKQAGLKGIEAYYVDNSEEDTQNLLQLASRHNLLVTGGSDFHGTYKTNIEIGIGRGNLKVPYELLNKMREI